MPKQRTADSKESKATKGSKDAVNKKSASKPTESKEMATKTTVIKPTESKEPVTKMTTMIRPPKTEVCPVSVEITCEGTTSTANPTTSVKVSRRRPPKKSSKKKKDKTVEEPGVVSPSVMPKLLKELKEKKEKNRDRTVETMEQTADKTTEKTDDYNEELLNNMSKALTFNTWFHGLMPRSEIAELLINDGDFLVRKTEVSKQVRYAVTVMYQGRIRHVLLNFKNEMWSLKDIKKPTVTELIETYVNDKIPVMADGTILITAVPRPQFYILHEHIELKNRLGGGAFGDVFKANMKNKDGSVTPVAVKRLKGMMQKQQRSEFIKEAKLMRRFDHANIIKIYGIAPQEEPILIVLELAGNGALTSKLKDNPEIDKNTLLRYATDACRGMCYLAGRKVIHRDIAARNCLLGKDDEVKISDFGMSVADKSVLKLDELKKMPVRWLSPEIIRKGEFSTKSDVWAFGVLVWEVFSRCKSDPFPGLTNKQAKERILSGEQPMQPPEGSPEIIKSLMMLCFIQDTEQRPDFEGALKLLAPKETPPQKIPDFETYTV